MYTFLGVIPLASACFLMWIFIGGPTIGLSERESLRILENFFLIFATLSEGSPRLAYLAIEMEPSSSASYHERSTVSFRSSETKASTRVDFP